MKNLTQRIILGAVLAASIICMAFPALAQEVSASGLSDDAIVDNQQSEVPEHVSSGQTSSVTFEQRIVLIKGRPQIDNAQLSVTYTCILCTPTTVNDNVSFDKGDIAGIRWEGWAKYLGFAIEWSVLHGGNTNTPNVPQVSFNFQSLYLIPVVRMPVLRSEAMPNGRLNLYGGFGLARIFGNMDVNVPPKSPFSTSIKSNAGTIFLIGVSLDFRKFAVLLERRATQNTLTSDNWAPGTSATIPVDTNGTIVGLAYKF